MTTLQRFIETGALGPLVLGTSLQQATDILGTTTKRSRKTNPLQLKYGACELVFIQKPETLSHRLREVALVFQPEFDPLPEAIRFNDFPTDRPPTESDFISFTSQINCSAISINESEEGIKSFKFASGINALIIENMLQSIRLSEKEAKQARPVTNRTEREPSENEIIEMLFEAKQAISAGAIRAGLLISWAALEAALRRRSHFLGNDSRLGQQVVVLIHDLLANGELTATEHRTIEQLRQTRAEIAHGLSPKDMRTSYFETINSLVTRLLQRS